MKKRRRRAMIQPRSPYEPTLVDPLAASRHPFEVFLLALALVSGAPLLFGRTNSGTVEAALPTLLVAAWGAMLILGSGLALIGVFWPRLASTGLILERSGLVGVGGAALIYAVIVALSDVGFDGLFSACIIGGFGAACFAQVRSISRRIDWTLQQVEKGRASE